MKSKAAQQPSLININILSNIATHLSKKLTKLLLETLQPRTSAPTESPDTTMSSRTPESSPTKSEEFSDSQNRLNQWLNFRSTDPDSPIFISHFICIDIAIKGSIPHKPLLKLIVKVPPSLELSIIDNLLFFVRRFLPTIFIIDYTPDLLFALSLRSLFIGQ
jgi:hypothetical protein